ncbi:hybrid sensor histidine kinase/response regulator [Imhoffiella purpurea]|uniref:Chemotaxis protein CheA n=1 Tax=Imhoffiella purpurea TaxID=1249627 RepID=W9VEN2_9GAMM|nr:response regulator [Imhoffiella purpurea]EXJ14502.1 CheA like protein [Imhoffiella purpurea]
MGAQHEATAEHRRPKAYEQDPDSESIADTTGEVEPGAGDADMDAASTPEESLQLQALECADALIQVLAAEDATVAERTQGFMDGLGAVLDVAAAMEATGLIDVCAILIDRLSQIEGQEADEETTANLLAQFPLLLMDYLSAPGEGAESLVQYLRHPHWRVGLADEELALLRASLCPPASVATETEAEPGEETVSVRPEDVSPVPAADTHAAAAESGVDGPDAEILAAFPPQSTSPEMLAFAATELESNYAAVEEALAALAAADGDADRQQASWTGLQDELSHLAAGAEAIGLTGLTRLLNWIQEQGGRLVRSGTLTMEHLATLAALPESLRGYFADPQAPERAVGLTDILYDLGGDASAYPGLGSMADYLNGVEVAATVPDPDDARPVVAESDAVSLVLPDDLNPELLEGLLTELPIQTATFTESVQRIVAGQGGASDIDTAKRAAHTLKGAANTVGVKGIANLAHHLEDLLIALGEADLLPNMGLAQTLGYAADCLEAMSEVLVEGGEPPADAVDVLQDVLNWANRIDLQGVGVAGVASADAAEAPPHQALVGRHETLDSASDHHAARPDGAVHMLRVPTSLVDEQLRLVGETMTSTAQIQNRLRLATQQVIEVGQQNQLLRQLIDDLVDLVDLRGVDLPRTQEAVDTGFDALELDQYGELHTVTRRLVEVVTDSSEMGQGTQEHLTVLKGLVEIQSRLQIESQNAVMRARMVPVTTVVSRLQRAVRQACRLLDKEVHLALQGADTLVDGNILNELVDGLMHLLRNAVDHGIEPPEERTAVGKEPFGLIQVAFKREGDSIIMTCRDDGRGLDLDQIRQAALRKGLIKASDALQQDQLIRLALTSGFSTRDEATHVSGRGIGLDAVDAMVQQLKGSMNLRTEQGRGLTVEIRLPTTLLSAQVLLARVRGKSVALATRGVEEIHFITLDQLRRVGGGLAFQYDDRLQDVVRLEDLLDLEGVESNVERGGYPLLRVRMFNGAHTSVLVDEVLESRNLVVKKLGVYVGKIDGVIGATILGDGSVAPVVDLPDLLRVSAGQQARGGDRSARRAEGAGTGSPQIRVPKALPKVLVVDDSISARRTTAQLFKDVGYEVHAAIDGLEASSMLEALTPDIVITDLEMPRMNGLEFAAHIRANSGFEHLPIVMITSRSTDRHRQQALAKGVDLYMVKPFKPEQLIEQVDTLIGRRA